jgi:hypothetical protein
MSRHGRRAAAKNSRRDDLIQKLADEIDRTASESDRRFFKDHPQRSRRIRHATWAEVSAQEVIDGTALPISPGRQCFVAVRQLQPGLRMRAFFIAPDAGEEVEEMPEDLAASWYEHVRPSQAIRIEQQMAGVFTPRK